MAGHPDHEGRAGRAMARCTVIAACTTEPGRITRPYGTPALVEARTEIGRWMEQAGMTTRVDALGTLRGIYSADHGSAAPKLILGSHIDSVRDAGRFDGVLGVMVAIAAVERLGGTKFLPFPIEVVAFPDEEGLRFGTTYLGSAALAGTFDNAWLDLRDDKGVTLREAVVECGGDPERIQQTRLHEGEAFAYIEVHIEQGPRLEAAGLALGAVTAISGQTRIVVQFTGEAGHAGTVPMNLRRDPVPAAAELVLATESMARATPDLLATVGRIDTDPGASNVIPGSVSLTLDVRHPADSARDSAVRALDRLARQVAAQRGLDLEWRVTRDHPATACHQDLVDVIQHSARDAMGEVPLELPSGAGHDAVTMSAIVPVGMMFIRCLRGVSHNPAESVTEADVAMAIDAMDEILDGLSQRAQREPSTAELLQCS